MLFARSLVVTTAKAYGLQAIDLVCINYLDMEELEKESREGRELGFDGKVGHFFTRIYITSADSQSSLIASHSPESSRDNSILLLADRERNIESSSSAGAV